VIDSDQMPAVVIPRQSLAAVVLSEAVAGPPPQALAALWLDFAAEYWSDGTEYASLPLVPGYTFTRSGQQGAVDSDGTVDWFTANAPAINGAGYHAYRALTNYMANSQDFSAWTPDGGGSTVTTNVSVAPDGTTTADNIAISAITNSNRYQFNTSVGAGVHTASMWVRVSSGTGKAYLSLLEGGSFWGAAEVTTCNLTTTWQRFVATKTLTGGGVTAYVVIGNHQSAGGSTDCSANIEVWQGELKNGNFPDGGPLIATAGASAAIGGSTLDVNDAPAAVDQLFWATGKFTNVPNTLGDYLAVWSDGSGFNGVRLFIASGAWRVLVTSGGGVVYDQVGSVPAINSIETVVLKREGGNWRAGKVVGGVLTWFGAASASAFPVGSVTLDVGSYIGGGNNFDNKVSGVFRKVGDFSTDAAVLAAVAETV
jgi:hypothetical protein